MNTVKKSLAFVLCIAMISSLFACAKRNSASPAVTTANTTADTAEHSSATAPADDWVLPYEKNAAPETLSVEELEYYSGIYEAQRSRGGFDNYTVKHYGTYNGAVVFFIADLPSEANLLSSSKLPLEAGSLVYTTSFSLEVFYKKEFTSLYVSVLFDETLTVDDLQAIRDYHEQNTFALPPFEEPANITHGKNSEAGSLTEEEKQNIADWYNYYYNLIDSPTNVASFWSNRKHYGTYNGCVILFNPGMLTAITEKTYGGYLFRHTRSFGITAFKDGVFMGFDEAIEAGWITGDALKAIHKYHNDNATLFLKIYDIDCPSDAAPNELPDEVMSEFITIMKQLEYDTDKLHHYGTYHGVTLFYDEGSDADASPNPIQFELNGEELYTDKAYTRFVVYFNGIFSDVTTFFAEHSNVQIKYDYALTEEDIKKIVEYHESRLPDELKRIYVELPENAEPESLSNESLEQLLDLFNTRYRTQYQKPFDRILHYGTHNDVTLLFIYDSELENTSDYPSAESITKSDWKYRLVAYKNGLIRTAYQAKNYGWITDAEISSAVAYHGSANG